MTALIGVIVAAILLFPFAEALAPITTHLIPDYPDVAGYVSTAFVVLVAWRVIVFIQKRAGRG